MPIKFQNELSWLSNFGVNFSVPIVFNLIVKMDGINKVTYEARDFISELFLSKIKQKQANTSIEN